MRLALKLAAAASFGAALVLSFGCSKPSSPEEKLFISACSQCHPIERPLGRRKTESGWRRTVSVMRQRGCNINDSEAETIVQYLVAIRSPQ